jgi:pimeloyl-ACP methyl ester carboxylesterase
MRFLLLIFTLLGPIVNGQPDSLNCFQLKVPVDHSAPDSGSTIIYYESGAPFSRQKPTVFVIADAQQFYVRKGAMTELQKALFDSTFNVVGIIGRNNNRDLKTRVVDSSGNINWPLAGRIFSWQQYVHDIDAVRKKLLGENGKVSLYGQSGGGLLVHQYLSMYGEFVEKAFTAASVDYSLDSESGINHDRFWTETCERDLSFATRFSSLMQKNLFPRELVAMLFQRQNFFIHTDSLFFERNKLLDHLLMNDTAEVNNYLTKYQIKDILAFIDSPDGIPVKVRLFEFMVPLSGDFEIEPDRFQPDLENLYFSCLPLIQARNKNQIDPVVIDHRPLHLLETEVFVLGGRWDHTADYRSQIALASIYRNHYLLIADDNHTFTSLKSNGLYNQLLVNFLKYGKEDIRFSDFMKSCESYRWKEGAGSRSGH